jgi:tRNA dimethylallyltransferase
VPVAAPCLIVAGPTASGKSALAAAAAEEFRGTVVNADSMQLYRDLRILSGQPDPAMLARAPHRLFGILRADQPSSAGWWRRQALAEIAAAAGERRLPIIVGGTGLYLEALVHGLHPVPPVPDDLRARLRQRLAAEGPAALHAELARGDPGAAGRLAQSDSQRIVRALEVLTATGRPLSEWQRARREAGPPGIVFRYLLLSPPREVVYAACDARFDHMLASGALTEAKHLAAMGLDPSLPIMKAVGLPPLLRHIRGELEFDRAVRVAKADTRHYAKRQMTWYRHRAAPDLILAAQYSESLNPKIFPFISDFVLTPSR